MEKQADNFLNKNLGKILKENKMIKETYNIRGGVDANGNHIVKIIPTSGKERGFSIQTNGKLKQTNRFFRGTNEISDPQEIEIAKIEIAHYVNQFGSPRQKAIIMEGKKTLKEGAEIFKANYANRIALGKLQRIFTDYKFLDEEQTIVGNEARQIESLLEDLEEKSIAPIEETKIDISDLKTISINLEESTEKIDYKKLQLPKLKSIVVEKGLASSSDASKFKKAELLKLLGIE